MSEDNKNDLLVFEVTGTGPSARQQESQAAKEREGVTRIADDRELCYVPLAEALEPADGRVVMKDYWWIVHPDRGLVFYRRWSPQCNKHESITRRLSSLYPWCEVRFLPLVFVERSPDE